MYHNVLENSVNARRGGGRQRILAAGLCDGYKAGLDTDGLSFKDDVPMLPSDLDRLTVTQRLVVEQAFVLAQELEAAADSAPEGQVINRCESFLLGNGRDFLKRVLESTLQFRVELLEKKTAPPESAPVARRDDTRGTRLKR
jgi:hypothetical protein